MLGARELDEQRIGVQLLPSPTAGRQHRCSAVIIAAAQRAEIQTAEQQRAKKQRRCRNERHLRRPPSCAMGSATHNLNAHFSTCPLQTCPSDLALSHLVPTLPFCQRFRMPRAIIAGKKQKEKLTQLAE